MNRRWAFSLALFAGAIFDQSSRRSVLIKPEAGERVLFMSCASARSNHLTVRSGELSSGLEEFHLEHVICVYREE